jgi:N6-L-threonylcarbamoyladenine synthase
MNILAIDTACDETSSAVIHDGKILSNVLPSQIAFHTQWGGVVPDIARRLHKERIDGVVEKALKNAGVTLADIDYIAVTQGPGLAIALEVGIAKAVKLSEELRIPLLPINHMEGHMYSVFAKNASGKGGVEEFAFPYLALLASGGHTELVIMHGHGKYEKIGEKLDDAIGEAFDKVGRMLDIGYPAGPILEQFAKIGNEHAIAFPIPLEHTAGYNFSYSGLKTAVSREVAKIKDENNFDKQHIYDVAASFQYAACEEILKKTDKALATFPVHGLVFGGGVSANLYIRHKLRSLASTYGIPLYLPLNKKLCTDNAAMIGVAAYWRIVANNIPSIPSEGIERIPRMSL